MHCRQRYGDRRPVNHVVSTILIVALATTGCSSLPDHVMSERDNRRVIAEWLDVGHRRIGVAPQDIETSRQFATRESPVLSGVAKGAGGGFLVGAAAGASAVGHSKCDGWICGAVILLIPVFAGVGLVTGAVVGGVGAEPQIELHPLKEFPTVSALFERLPPVAEFNDRLAQSVADAAAGMVRHDVTTAPRSDRPLQHRLPDARFEGIVAVSVTRIWWLAAEGDETAADPNLRLLIEGRSEAVYSVDEKIRSLAPGSWEFVGESRKLSELAADSDAALEDVLTAAITATAEKIAGAMLQPESGDL